MLTLDFDKGILSAFDYQARFQMAYSGKRYEDAPAKKNFGRRIWTGRDRPCLT